MTIWNKIYHRLHTEAWYLWFRGHQRRRRGGKVVKRYYSAELPEADHNNKTVVYLADGRTSHGGLADRLRGMVSIYDVCRENGVDFRIHFTSPFRLERYLQPNRHEWRIDDNALSYSTSTPLGYFIDATDENINRENRFQRKLLRKFVGSRFRQAHVYTNYTCGEERFAELFNELFRPTEIVKEQIDKAKSKLGEGYISVSTRFLELLGDFREPRMLRQPLGESERRKLIDSCISRIQKIHDRYCSDGRRILVTSDSTTFLSRIKELPYVETIEGSVSHIDASDTARDDADLKTFVDFFAIAGATKSFLLIGPGMYNSNFSKRAAQIGGHDFTTVNF